MLMIGLAAGGVLVGLLRVILEVFWGPNEKLRKIEAAITERRALEKAEGRRLQDETAKIDQAPKATGQDLQDKLNKSFEDFGR